MYFVRIKLMIIVDDKKYRAWFCGGCAIPQFPEKIEYRNNYKYVSL